MDNRNKIFIVLLSLVVSMSFVIGEDRSLPYPLPQDSCGNLVQTCDNCTYVNITKVLAPNSSAILLGQFPMTKNGTEYNYTFCSTSSLGTYFYTTCGDLGGVLTCQNVDFEVTPDGLRFTSEQSTLYIILLILMVSVFLIFIYGFIKLEWKHHRDQDNIILAVNWKKLGKVACASFSYLTLMWIFGILSMISRNYLLSTALSKYFEMFYLFMLYLALPIIIISIITISIIYVQNIDIQKKLNRGFEIYG